MVRIEGTLHLVLHILTTCLHLDVALSIQISNPVLFWICVSTVVASSLITNTASMIMAYWNMDFASKRTGEFICVFSHLLQLGPIWRYMKLLVTRDDGDVLELGLLRLGHCVVQDAVLLVIEANIILDNVQHVQLMPALAATLAIISMSFSFGSISYHCTFSKKGLTDDESLHKSTVSIRILGRIAHGGWHFFSLQARMLSFSFFVRTTHLWAILAPSIHLLCHYAIIYVNLYVDPTKQNPQCKEIIQKLLVGYTQMFDHIGKAYQVCTSCVYFVVVSVENVIMITTWFVSTENTSLNTGIFVYVFLCHVIGTLSALVVNQRDGRKLQISKQPSSVNNIEKVEDASNQIDSIGPHQKDTIDTGVDFDTVIEYMGESERNQTKHESRLKSDKLPLTKTPPEESRITLEALDIMRHLISYNQVNTQQDSSINELSSVTQLETHINDHESSNSRNTNTVISSISSTIRDTFNGNELGTHEQESTNRKDCKSKAQSRWKNNMFERPLPEPPWPHGKSTQESNNKFERKWRSFSNSTYENLVVKGKVKPSHLRDRHYVPQGAKTGKSNNPTKTLFGKALNRKTNKSPKGTTGVFPYVNFNTVIPRRKSKEKPKLFTQLDWDLEMYTTGSSTTDYTSLPPRRRENTYEPRGVLSSLYSDYNQARRWRGTCSTCSSTDYYDLDDSEFGETWTWPPSKPGLTKESVYGLPRNGLSPRDNVTKWLCDIPDEQFV